MRTTVTLDPDVAVKLKALARRRRASFKETLNDVIRRGLSAKHPAQVLPDYATKTFNKARGIACDSTDAFKGLSGRQLPTLHEIRALSSHLYAKAGYEVSAVQDLMAHTDPDMTRAYQKGHARKVLRIDMMLPFSVEDDERTVREEPARYAHATPNPRQETFPENFLTKFPKAA